MGDKNFGIDPDVIARYARMLNRSSTWGVQVAIVIGGGNIYRGMNEATSGIERAQGDYMGMLATVINGMAVQSGLRKPVSIPACKAPSKWNRSPNLISAVRAMRHLEKAAW